MKAKRGLLKAAGKARVIIQDYAAVDQFGELPERKRGAERLARQQGHQLSGWHRRQNDPQGHWDAWCQDCGMLAVVVTEPRPGIAHVYGKALELTCRRVTQ